MSVRARSCDIALTDVTFRYADPSRRDAPSALESVGLSIASGDVLGLVGHNGAGKSTLLAIIAGLLEPSVGSASIDGRPASECVGTGRVGLLTAKLRLYPNFSVAETLRVFARLHGSPTAADDVERVIDAVAVRGYRDAWVGTLSTGLRKRVALAVLLLSDPDVLLLDEPFAGLDPQSVEVVSALIARAAREGCAVIVASHDLPELEEVAHHVLVLRQSRAIAYGRVDDLRRLAGAQAGFCAETDQGVFPLPGSLRELIPHLQELERRGVELRAITQRRASLTQVYAALHDHELERVVA